MIVSLVVSVLVLARGYVFMLALEYEDLGRVALIQSIIVMTGFMQFGVFTGGHRLFISASERHKERINRVVYSFTVTLGLVFAALAALAIALGLTGGFDTAVALGTLGGIATLFRNWQTLQLIATMRFKSANRINIASIVISLALLGLIPVDPLAACLAALVAQPLLFTIFAAIFEKDQRPGKFELPVRFLKRFLKVGFLVFFVGVLLQLNLHIERAYVTAALGLEALGHLYLAAMVVGLVQLLPASLNSVFIPDAVRAYTDRNGPALARTMQAYLGVLIGYAALCGLAVWLGAEPLLAVLAPKYVDDLVYVYILLPGCLLLVVSGAMALTFSVLIRYRHLVTAYGAGTLLLCLIFGGALAAGTSLTLIEVSLARTLGLTVTAALVAIGWWLLTMKHPGFRFRARDLRPPAAKPTIPEPQQTTE